MNAAYTVFGKELRDAVRGRWLIAFAATFAVLALGLAMLQQDGSGDQGFSRTTAGLLNLCLLLVPLLALVVGSGAIAGERERGTLATLLGQPMSASQLLLGKYAGLSVALWAAIVLGFGAAGVIVGLVQPVAGIGHYLLFMVLAGILANAMLSVGTLLSVLSRSRVRALGLAVLIWFVLVLLYDLAAIGLALALTSSGESLLVASVLNPVESIRILAVLTLEPDLHVLGPMGAYLRVELGTLTTVALLVGAIATWLVAPVLVAVRVFGEQDV